MILLLNFIYAGETEISHDELGAFMALANSLEIQGLVGNIPDRTNEEYEQVDDAEVKEEFHMHESLVDEESFDTINGNHYIIDQSFKKHNKFRQLV